MGEISIWQRCKHFWRQHKKFFLILFVLIIFFFLSIVLHQYSVYHSHSIEQSIGFGNFVRSRWHFDFFANNTGGIFTILIGLATMLGIYIAYMQIKEQKSIITTYSQLMDNLTELLNDKNSGEIRIVSHFILPGFWQVADTTKRNNFYSAFKTHTEKIKITCITREEHLSILIDMANRGIPPAFIKPMTKKEIISFQKQCEGLLDQINDENKKRLSYLEMPHYFFFVSNKRAIIITPIGLPNPNKRISDFIKKDENNDNYNVIIEDKDTDKNIDKYLSPAQVRSEEAKVHTLGFATADHNIIEMLKTLYNQISGS